MGIFSRIRHSGRRYVKYATNTGNNMLKASVLVILF